MRPSLRSALILVLLAGCLHFASGGAAAQTGGPVELISTDPFHPVMNAQIVSVRIPVRMRGAASPADVRIAILGVDAPGGRGSVPDSAFTVAIASQAGRGSAITVRVRSSQVRKPGPYTLTISARRISGRASRGEFPIVIEVPAAEIAAPALLHIDQRVGLLPGRAARTVNDSKRLDIRESGGKRRIPSLRIVQLDRPNTDRGTNTGTIEFRTMALAPGQVRRVDYKVRGTFPIGTTKGTLQVIAPELATDLKIPYEVTVRRRAYTLVLLLIAGLFLGFLTRSLLAVRIAVRQARVQADRVQERIANEISMRHDTDFRAKAEAISTTLKQAAGSREPAGITEATATAMEKLDEALQELAERREATAAKLATLGDQLFQPRVLSAPVAAIRKRGRDLHDDATQRLSQDDVKGADAKVRAIETDLTEEMLAATRRLARPARALGTTLEAETNVFGEQVAAAGAELRETASAAPPTDLGSAMEYLSKLAEAIHTAVTRLAGEGIPLADEALSRLSPEDAGVEAARAARERLGRRLGSAPMDDPGPAVASLTDFLAKFKRAIESAVGSGAADELRMFLHGPGLRALMSTSSRPRGAAASTPVDVAAPAAEQPASPATLAAVHQFLPRPDVSPAATRRALIADQALQLVIAALILTWIGYVMWESTYEGTVEQMLGIFLWAFAIDVSVDRILQLRPAPAAPSSPAPPAPAA